MDMLPLTGPKTRLSSPNQTFEIHRERDEKFPLPEEIIAQPVPAGEKTSLSLGGSLIIPLQSTIGQMRNAAKWRIVLTEW